MNATHLFRNTLFYGIALALLTPVAALSQTPPDSTPAAEAPQTEPPDDATRQRGDVTELATVSVTGVRGSLARSTELKRDAAVVQDSISALELGKFPDDNVADSLSHITGVAITRTAGG